MAPVELYVYDLSNGLAKSLSLALTGKQIEGIWHTSVVVFGREVYYGQGILESSPGRTHHGPPLQKLTMGDTGLDEDTFNEYIDGLKDHYRADKYHLLDFNCNSFTADVVGFLTGGTIPSYISSLPSDFLSTPFGAALRPQIDQMFNPNSRPATPAGSNSPSSSRILPTPPPSASLLQSVVTQAMNNPNPSSASGSSSTANLTSPLLLATSSASLHAILSSNRAVVGFFFSAGGQGRQAEGKFESVARSRGGGGVAFVSIDTKVGRGQEVKEEWGVQAEEGFVLWLDGRKIDELEGVGEEGELESKIDGLIYQAHPPHPHKTTALPLVQAILPSPILFTLPPAYAPLLTKLSSFLTPLPPPQVATLESFLSTQVVPFLETKSLPPSANLDGLLQTLVKWSEILFDKLPPSNLFPLIDLWRLLLLDHRVSSSLALSVSKNKSTPISLLLDLLLRPGQNLIELPRPLLITSVRFLSNTFASLPLATLLLSPELDAEGRNARARLTAVLVEVLLHEDAGIRGAAAALAFNISGVRHRKSGGVGKGGEEVEIEEEGDWVLELVIALVEAVRMEEKSEDVVYRLLSALGLLLYLSPYISSTLGPNLEVIGARDIIESKLPWVKKREVRGLISEIGRMCA